VGKSTAGLPLTGRWAGGHYERCPADGTVYRSKRRTRFRCPSCHALAYTVPTPAGEPGQRRTLEGDESGRVYRILERRRAEGEATPVHGTDVVLFLEEPDAAPPAPDTPPPDPPAPGPRRPKTPAAARAAAAREESPRGGLIGRIWRGSLGDLRKS
jgi:hypothetical protein